MNAAHRDDDDEKPLDPAVEKVRQRLVRFVGINLAILFVALMVVVVALVYKSMSTREAVPAAARAPLGDAAILVPAGARIVSQSLDGDRLSLHVTLPDGRGDAILIYGLGEGRVLATLPVRNN